VSTNVGSVLILFSGLLRGCAFITSGTVVSTWAVAARMMRDRLVRKWFLLLGHYSFFFEVSTSIMPMPLLSMCVQPGDFNVLGPQADGASS